MLPLYTQDLLKVNLVRAVKAPISDGMVAAIIKERGRERATTYA